MKPSPRCPASSMRAPALWLFVPDPTTWVDEHGDTLYRYALVRVRRPEVAEDLVQETLLAAFKGRDGYAGKSTERTWLIGILRHKILDYLRSRSRGMDGVTADGAGEWLEQGFDERGRLVKPPGRWSVEPEALAEHQEFWKVLHQCLDDLPPRSREIFARRMMEQQDSELICKELEITATNLWVILHRARALLRKCLELYWFGEARSEKADK